MEYRKIYECKLSSGTVNLAAITLLAILFLGFWALTLLLPWRAKDEDAFMIWLLPSIFLFVPLHEGLHALAALGDKNVSRDKLKFGFNTRHAAAYCHVKVPVSITRYRLICQLPLYILGPIVLILLIIYPSLSTAFFAATAFSGSVADFWMVFKTMKFPNDLMIYDHPKGPGFDLLATPQQTQQNSNWVTSTPWRINEQVNANRTASPNYSRKSTFAFFLLFSLTTIYAMIYQYTIKIFNTNNDSIIHFMEKLLNLSFAAVHLSAIISLWLSVTSLREKKASRTLAVLTILMSSSIIIGFLLAIL